jgi:hypothetical protein
LRRRGYRRIGLAISPEVEARCQHGFSAGLFTYQQYIAKSDVVPILNTDFKRPEQIERWVERHRAQVILTPHVNAPAVLSQLKLRVPEDVALAHTDWHPAYTGWAGVDHRVETAGRAATDMVVTQLFTNQRGLPAAPITMLTRGVWVDGPSVRTIGPPAALPRLPRSTVVKD